MIQRGPATVSDVDYTATQTQQLSPSLTSHHVKSETDQSISQRGFLQRMVARTGGRVVLNEVKSVQKWENTSRISEINYPQY